MPGFVGLSVTDSLFAPPSTAIYLAKKNIKRKGILEEYEKVRRNCTRSITSPLFSFSLLSPKDGAWQKVTSSTA